MGQTFRKLFDSIFGNKEMRVRSCVLSFFLPFSMPPFLVVLFRHPFIAVSIFCLFLSSWRKKGGKRVERKWMWLFSLYGKLGKILVSRRNASVILRDCALSGIPVGKSSRLSEVYPMQICIQKYFLHALMWNWFKRQVCLKLCCFNFVTGVIWEPTGKMIVYDSSEDWKCCVDIDCLVVHRGICFSCLRGSKFVYIETELWLYHLGKELIT